MNRTPIVYLKPREGMLHNLLRILAACEIAFPATRVPRHKLRWVRTSSVGGYWETI